MDQTSRYPRNRLKRNTACTRCNARKIKCDAVRPVCGGCERHNRHLHRSKTGTGSTIVCFYDDPPEEVQGSSTQCYAISRGSATSGPSPGSSGSDWPTDLPPRPLLNHLVGIFFTSVPSLNHLFHQANFTARLAQPSSHPEFPHLALLHAICVIAARFTAAVEIESVEESVRRRAQYLDGERPQRGTDNGSQCFAGHHARLATVAMDIGETYGRGLLEMCQAQVILFTHYLYTSQFHQGYLMAGHACRLGQFLGLMKEPVPGQVRGRWASLLPRPQSDIEREEYRRLACSIVMCDTAVSLCDFDAMALDAENLALRMPASYADFHSSVVIPENDQSIRTLMLFDEHPVQDSFVMYIKSMMLLRLVIDFRRRSEVQNPQTGKTADWNEPVFHFLKRACRDFVGKLPPALSNPIMLVPGLANGFDADLISAHILPHVVTIIHCEPYVKIEEPKCENSRSLLAAAFSVSQILQMLLNRNVDWKTSVVPLLALFLQIVAHSLLQYYRQALRSADLSNVTTTSTALDTVKEALSKMASHNAVAYLMLKQVQSSLDDINREVFSDPTASLDATRIQPLPQVTNLGGPEEIKWDEFLLWPISFEEQSMGAFAERMPS